MDTKRLATAMIVGGVVLYALGVVDREVVH